MTKPLVHLSQHAKERLRERHDRHLLPYTDARTFELSCYELLDRAEETRRHLNDTVLMTELYADYGYNKQYSFKVYANALFIIVDNFCVTVLDTNKHAYSRQFTLAAPVPVSKQLMPTNKQRHGAGPAYKTKKRNLISDR